jgi:hypothetical protein
MESSPTSAELLGDVMVLEYAGALRPDQVRTAIRSADRELPAMRDFPDTRDELVESTARRLLTQRLAGARSTFGAVRSAASARSVPVPQL